MIAYELDRFELMFDVIANDARKYASNIGKLTANADEHVEQFDVVTIHQVRTERRAVKHASRFNLQR